MFLRLFKESFAFAVGAIVVNKLRTFLSILGITIGIFTIISVFTVVDGLENTLKKNVSSLGSDVIYVQKWPWAFGPDYPWWKYLNRPEPDLNDFKTLSHDIKSAKAVSFVVPVSGKTVKHGGNSIEKADIWAVSEDYDRVKSFDIADGRYFSSTEMIGGKPMAVIGDQIAEKLFGSVNPIGKNISAMGMSFQIIGQIKKEGESMVGMSSDKQILIPVNAAKAIIDFRSERIHPFIIVKAAEGIENAELKDEISGILRSTRRIRPMEENNFALNESSLMDAPLAALFGVINITGIIIGGFSILVGGFGIANIMFVSVRERTNIIGIQKSLGAKNYFILVQFLSEAVILCLLGGIIGLIMIWLGTLIITNLSDYEISLSLKNIINGLGISMIIGIISGFTPAYKASRMDPVEAIRTGI